MRSVARYDEVRLSLPADQNDLINVHLRGQSRTGEAGSTKSPTTEANDYRSQQLVRGRMVPGDVVRGLREPESLPLRCWAVTGRLSSERVTAETAGAVVIGTPGRMGEIKSPRQSLAPSSTSIKPARKELTDGRTGR